MHFKRILYLSTLALLAVVVLRAQSLSDDEIKLDSRPYIPPPEVAIRRQANLVQLRVVVRDARGQPVPGLQQSDFELLDNGKPQVISAFSVESLAAASSAPVAPAGPAAAENPAPPAPVVPQTRYIALYFDDLSMPVRDLVPVRTAGQSFVISHLQPGVIYAGTKPALMYISNDNGLHWDELPAFRKIFSRRFWFSPAETPFVAYVQGITLSPTDQNVIIAGIEFGAVVRSTNGGETWEDHRPGALRDC